MKFSIVIRSGKLFFSSRIRDRNRNLRTDFSRHLLDLMIGGSPLENPEELANYILDKVLELAAGKAGDDMTVLVAGIWKMCYSR